jgi:uncharacterized protein YeaO (DUF488 family)
MGFHPVQRQGGPVTIAIKRAYAPAGDRDGVRILVDRIWPRGISRQKAHIHFWDKDVAPSTALRKWFGHRPQRWAEFQRRYRAELKDNPALESLRRLIGGKRATLVYGAKDEAHNQAVVLKALLDKRPVHKVGRKKKRTKAKRRAKS